MMSYTTGDNGEYYWIEISEGSLSISDLLLHFPGILSDKYLAIVSSDSGPLKLSEEEKKAGWYEKDGIAYSPKLTEDLMAALPHEQYDQWCLFAEPTEFTSMTCFVNYSGFTLTGTQKKLHSDETGVSKTEKQNFREQEIRQFWLELDTINPVNFVADGDYFIFISNNKQEIDTFSQTIN